ncbi:MAG TPA: Na+/H+ antiporter NhaA [Bacteroidales bacterium]|nr:Na+/H+ antiporter NhaA [Bacteroidales bacterium]
MRLTKLFKEFFVSEKAGGLLLIMMTIFSLVFANSVWKDSYINFWDTYIAGDSIAHWINDGLMTIFFLLVGLELEREFYQGELSDIKNASFPIFAAIGGMFVPATLFLIINFGSGDKSGAGIPMATDIAFAIGILSLLGNRVPGSLKVFLTALAIIDDLGAIIIIAVFYTASLSFSNLFIALAIFGILIILNRIKVYSLIPYIIGGIAMWYFMLHSGVHATITGILLAFAIPYSREEEKSPSLILQHHLHKPVAFVILPLFALANTSIAFGENWISGLGQTNSLGIMAGLIIGKPVGIFLFSFIGVALGLCVLPEDLKWGNIIGVGFLGGIGFTMSIFITILAFNDSAIISMSKIAIIFASVIAGITGYILLKRTLKEPVIKEDDGN